MAGGTWQTQNKVRPGVYINFQSEGGLGLSVGNRGVVTICEPMSWGPVGQVMTVQAGEDTTPYCGYPITAPQARFLQQIFLGTNRTAGAQTVYLYRPTATSSAQATAEISPLTATALYPGARGNDITISIVAVPDSEDQFTVNTIVDGTIVDSQTVAQCSDLVANDWVTWSGTGAVAANAGTKLTGGLDGTVEASAYTPYLTAIEPYDFDIMIYDGDDSTTLTAMQSFIERICSNGQYAQLVASFSTAPDSQYIINVQSGLVLPDNVTLTPQQTCWWVGGAEAGASYNETLTYATHPTAVAPSPVLTNTEVEEALSSGELVMTADFDTVHIEQDINSLTTYTQALGKIFRKNRLIRLCNTIANDIYQQFSANYLGVVNNNEAGRNLFKSAIVGYMLTLQGQEAIQNFSADDVEVLAGTDNDSIIVNVAIQSVDSVEKIYMTVTVS